MVDIEKRNLVGAVDQGTSSSRFLIFDSKTAELITFHQTDLPQIYPKEGWVEQDPKAILSTVETCIEKAVENLKEFNISPANIKAVGITNQRETTIVWDKQTGEPLYNAIVWSDVRTSETLAKLINKTPTKSKDYLRGRVEGTQSFSQKLQVRPMATKKHFKRNK